MFLRELQRIHVQSAAVDCWYTTTRVIDPEGIRSSARLPDEGDWRVGTSIASGYDRGETVEV